MLEDTSYCHLTMPSAAYYHQEGSTSLLHVGDLVLGMQYMGYQDSWFRAYILSANHRANGAITSIG